MGILNESAQTEGKLYRNMIEKVAKDKEINVILVASYDRFSRTGPEGIMTKAYFKSKRHLCRFSNASNRPR